MTVLNQWGTLARTPWPYHFLSAPPVVAGCVFATTQIMHAARGMGVLTVEPWFVGAVTALVGLLLTAVGAATTWVKTAGYVPGFVYSLVCGTTVTVFLTWGAVDGPYSVRFVLAFLLNVAVIGPFYGLTNWTFTKQLEDAAAAKEEAAEKGKKEDDKPEFPDDEWEAILHVAGFPGMVRKETKEGPLLSMLFDLGKHQVANVKQGLEKIEATAAKILDKPLVRGAINVIPHEFAGLAQIVVDIDDVLSKPVPYKMDYTHPSSISEPKVFNLRKDGTPTLIKIPGNTFLNVGVMGSGKSRLLHATIADATACDDCVVWVAALQKANSLIAPWLAPYLTGKTKIPLLDSVALTPEEIDLQLQWLEIVVEERQNAPRGGAEIHPASRHAPHIYWVVDEAPDIMSQVKNAAPRIRERARVNRSEGISIKLATQGVTTGFMGMDDASLQQVITATILHRVAKQGHASYALGGSLPAVGDMSKLKHPGTSLVQYLDEPEMLGRGRDLDPVTQVPILAERHTAWKPSLEPSLVRALGPSYANRWSEERFGETRRKLTKFLSSPEDWNDEDDSVRERIVVAQGSTGGKVEQSGETGKEEDNMSSEIPDNLKMPELLAEWAEGVKQYEEFKKNKEREEDTLKSTVEAGLADLEAFLAGQSVKEDELSKIDNERVRTVFEIIMDAGVEGVARADVIGLSGYAVSTVAQYLSLLKAQGLIASPSHGVYVATRFL